MMTQTDYIRDKIDELKQMRLDYGLQVDIATTARNIVKKLIRANKKELRRFIKWENKERRLQSVNRLSSILGIGGIVRWCLSQSFRQNRQVTGD
jgi:uncharacterized coiled-coil DUF342 family protein